jgi:hypothetical protein
VVVSSLSEDSIFFFFIILRMPNTNGLTSLPDVYFTGAPDSNIWASKVAPTVVSPLNILSPDGTQSGTISVASNGNMTMTTNLAGAGMRIGNGNNLFMSPNGTTNAQLVVENDGDVALYQGGGSTMFIGVAGTIAFQDLSTAPVLRVGAAQGRIYDSVYNKAFTYTTLQSPQIGTTNIIYDEVVGVPAGVYQLQLSMEGLTALGTSSNFLTMSATDPTSPTPARVLNFSGAQIPPGAVGPSVDNLLSGFFTHAGGDLRVQVQNQDPSTPTPPSWTSTEWALQLVKLG